MSETPAGGNITTFVIDTSDTEKKLDDLLKRAENTDIKLSVVDEKSDDTLSKVTEKVEVIGGTINSTETEISESERKLDELLKMAGNVEVELESVDRRNEETLSKTEETVERIGGIVTSHEEDISDAEKKLDDLFKKADDVNIKLDAVDKKGAETIARAGNAISGVIRGFQSIFTAFGESIGPLQTAILGAVFTGIQAVINIALTYETNPYTAIYGAIIAGIAIATQIATGIAVQQGMNDAAQSIRTAQNIISSVSGFVGVIL